MREFKFRAFNKNEKKMCRVISSDFIEMVTVRFPEFESTDFDDDYNDQMELSEFEPLMQYTSLKDINGVEIFEGNIVEREVFAFGEIRTFTGEVKMFECAWWIDSGTAAVSLWNEMHELKVIGNIYEHPELLGDSQ